MKPHLPAIVLLAMLALPASAQEAGFATPRTSWGAPDLQGYWNNTSLTVMERPETAKTLVVSEEQAASLNRGHVLTRAAQGDRRRVNLSAEATFQLLADGNTSRAHNEIWNDPGASYAKVKGEYRTSWIVAPEDGLIPYLDREKQGAPRNYDVGGPEERPQSERCLMSFTGSAGPVMNNGLYNNTYQIVQTPGSVMILTEMIHDVRIVPISAKGQGRHGPVEVPKWGGDSIGWYEGDTLVVETVNPHPRQRSFITAKGKLTERFTRWSNGQILYEFEIEDPSLYTRAWKGEMALNVSHQPLYEYACHEGNYSLEGILAGARQFERDGRPRQRIQQPWPGIDVTEGQ